MIIRARIKRWYDRYAGKLWHAWQLYMLQRRLRNIIRRHPPGQA